MRRRRTPLHLWDCNGTAAQRWSIEPSSELKARGKCMDLSGGKCVEVTGGSSASGTLMRLATCNGSLGQRWNPI